MTRFFILPISFVLFLSASCNLPKDPERTLDRARGKVLRVGVTESPPWIERKGDEATGPEAEVVSGFADSIGAQVDWIWGGADENCEALENFQIDMVAAGLNDKSMWKAKIGVSKPYMSSAIVAARDPASPTAPLRNLPIAILEGDKIGDELGKRDAKIERVKSFSKSHHYVAGQKAVLEGLGYIPFALLTEEKRVLAVPPGENSMLVALETYYDHERSARSRIYGMPEQ